MRITQVIRLTASAQERQVMLLALNGTLTRGHMAESHRRSCYGVSHVLGVNPLPHRELFTHIRRMETETFLQTFLSTGF